MPRTNRAVVVVAMITASAAVIGVPASAGPAATGPLLRSYEVSHLPSLGGSTAVGTSLNGRGVVAGYSTLDGNATMHATVWREGEVEDLRTLGGPNSAVLWPGRSERLVVGVAETDQDNPLGEDWSCSAFFPGDATGKTCLGFVYEAGAMRALPTLGGHNGFAAGVNRRGEIVGWAENTVVDPTCTGSQVLQFRAVVWGPGEDDIRELPPLPGDSASAATAINAAGQVVGISGDCDMSVGRFTAKHAVLWDGDEVIDLGNLGGEAWHTPMAISNRGVVVGFSNPTGVEGGAFAPHAFRWTADEGMTDLGTLDGDTSSQALGVNSRGKIVGVSSGGGVSRAVVWKHDVPTDLNLLVGAGDQGSLTAANDVSRRGVLTGTATDPETGDTVAFRATRQGRSID